MKLKLKTLIIILAFSPLGRINASNNDSLKLCSDSTIRLTIKQIFSMAEQNSNSIKKFFLRELEAIKNLENSKIDNLPNINLSASFSYLGDGRIWERDFTNGQKAPMPHYANNFGIELWQNIYSGGAIKAIINISEEALNISKIESEINRQELRMFMIVNYLEIFKLDNQLEIFNKNIYRTNLLINDIYSKNNAGIVLKNDITRYQLQLQALELGKLNVYNTRKILNKKLSTIIGLANDIKIIPIIDNNFYSVVFNKELSINNLMYNLSSTSPVLQVSEASIKLNEHKLKLSKADKLPSISLFAADKLDGPIVIEVPPLNVNFNYWYAGIGIKYNISSLYKSKSKIDAAKIAIKEAQINNKEVHEELEDKLYESLLRFNESKINLITKEKGLALAEENYRIINNRYLQELAIITEMLDADNQRIDAQLQLENAKVNILLSYFTILKLKGILNN